MTNQQLAEMFAHNRTQANRTAVFVAFKPLAERIVLMFHKPHKSPQDEQQEAYIQLNNAITTYNANKGASFLTYAYKCIYNHFVNRERKKRQIGRAHV